MNHTNFRTYDKLRGIVLYQYLNSRTILFFFKGLDAQDAMDTGDNGLCSILQEKKMWNGENASNRQPTVTTTSTASSTTSGGGGGGGGGGGCKDRCLVCSVCNKFSSKKVNVMQHLLANHNAGNELLGSVAELSPSVPTLARKPFDYLRTLAEARCAQNLRLIEKVTFMSESFALKENCNDLKHGNLAEMLEQYAAARHQDDGSPTQEKQQHVPSTLSCPLCAEAFHDQATVETHVLRVHNMKMDGLNRLLKLVDTSQFLKTTSNGKSASGGSSPVEKMEPSQHSPSGKEGAASPPGAAVSPGVPSIRCAYCKASFDTMVDLKIHCNESSHFRRSAETDDLACFLHDCKDAFDNLADLNQHFKASHLNFLISEHHTYRYRCKQCPFAFKTHEKLSRHLFYHSLRESTKCFYCDHHFKNIHSLTAHITEKHPQEALQSGKPSPPGIPAPDASILFFKDIKRKMQQQQQRNGLSPRSDRSGGRGDTRDSVDEDRLSEKSVSSKSSSFYYEKSLDGSGTSDGRFTCTDCQFSFTDSGALERHLATACHMPRDDKASPDTLAASLMSSLAKHHQQQQQQQQQQHQSQQHQQLTSSSTSQSAQMGSLFYDIKSEKFTNPNRPFKCTICMESFTQKNILLVHYNSVSHLNKLKKLKAEKGFAQMFTGSLLGADGGGGSSDSGGCPDPGNNSPSPTIPFGEKATTPFSMPSFAEGGGGGEKRKDVGEEKESARKKFKCDICNVAYTQGSTLDIHMRSVLHQTRACRLQERSLFSGQSTTAQQQQQLPSPQGVEGKKKSEFPLIHPIPESHDQSPNMLDEVPMRKLKSPSEHQQQLQQQQQLFCGVPGGAGTPDKPEICVCDCCYQVFPGKLMLETHLELSPECLSHRKKLLDSATAAAVAAVTMSDGVPLGYDASSGFQHHQQQQQLHHHPHHQALSELAKVNALTAGGVVGGGFDLSAAATSDAATAALLGAKGLVPAMDPAATAAAAAAAANLMDPSFLKNASLLQFAAADPTNKLNPNALNVLNFMHFHHLMSLSYLNLAPQLSFGGVPPKVGGGGDPTKPDGGSPGLVDHTGGTKGKPPSSGVLPPVSLNGKPLDLNLLSHGLDPKLTGQSPQHVQQVQQQHQQQQAQQQQQQQPCTQKRARTRITDEQLRILRSHFDINNSPSEESIQEMSLKANLPQKVVKHWFRNTLFKERQRNKDSPYNFSIPPSTKLNVEEYERTGEAKVTDLETSFKAAAAAAAASDVSVPGAGALSQDSSQSSSDMSKALNEAMKQNLSKSLLESLSKHQQSQAAAAAAAAAAAVGQDLVGAAAAFHLNKSLFPDGFGGGGGGVGGTGVGPVGGLGPDFSGADMVGTMTDYFQRAAADAAVALGPGPLSIGGTPGGNTTPGGGGGGGTGNGGNGGGGGGKKKKIKSESSNDSPTPADLQLDSSNSSPMPMRPPSAISLKKHMATPPTLVVSEEMKIPSPIESPVISPPGSMGGMHGLPPQTQPITCSNGKRANRTRFTDYQIKVLQEFFENNSYPKDSDLEYLSKLLMLSPRVIVVWFQNARQKQRKIYENQPNPTFESDEKKAININYTCKKCNLVFQRYYELIRHQKNHCFKEESNKRSAKAQLAAAQIAHSFTSGSEDSDSSLDVSRRDFQPRENDCPF